MKTILKRISLFALCLAMLAPAVLTSAFAAEGVDVTAESTAAADVLNELGLFNGKGTNADGTPIYALEETASRIEGLVMLIRMLGEEADALAYTGECPFTDVPAWAERHAAYAYAKGYVNGTTATTYTPDGVISGQQYAVLLLRALGFNEKNGDFTYAKACEKAVEVGLFDSATDYEGDFFRAGIVTMSLRAMTTGTKEGRYLSEQLKEKINTQEFADALVKHGLVKEKTFTIPYDAANKTILTDAIRENLPDAYYVCASGSRGNGTDFSIVQWHTEEVRLKLLAGCWPFHGYITGKDKTLPELTWPDSLEAPSGRSTRATVQVLDSEYRLIAYSVVPDGYKEDVLTFTICQVGGREDLKAVRDSIVNTPEVDASAFYGEDVKTIHADGTEEVVSYFRIKESKIPSDVMKNVKYYRITNSSNDAFTVVRSDRLSLHKDIHGTVKPYEGENTVVRIWGSKNTHVLLYDQNENVIAYAELPSGLTVVETVIEK